jgi:hypothetical protein
MQNQISPDFIKSFWEPRFPGQVPSQLVAPEVLEGDTIHLESCRAGVQTEEVVTVSMGDVNGCEIPAALGDPIYYFKGSKPDQARGTDSLFHNVYLKSHQV